jgi:hypothetical protein
MTNFPIKMKAPATNGVAVFDYEGKKDFRFLVACSDQKIYNFDKAGQVTKGWNPKATIGVIKFPLQHFRVANKDYIVFSDKSHLNILDRQGKERVSLKSDFELSANDVGLLQVKGSPSFMVTTDKQGSIRLVGFDGSVKKLATGARTGSHYFLSADLNGSGIFSFYIYDKRKLYRFDQSGRVIFTIDVDLSVDQAPMIGVFGNKRLIVLNSSAENRSLLMSEDGSIVNTFYSQSNLLAMGNFESGSNIESWITRSSDGFISNYQVVLK